MPSASPICTLTPKIIVEQQDASCESGKRRRGRPQKIEKGTAYEPVEVELQKQAIIEQDTHVDDFKEVDILADLRAMQCSDWETLSSSDRKPL